MTDEEKTEYEKNLAKVDWNLPGMENFSDERKKNLSRAILNGTIVDGLACLGWALWPTKNEGYYDEAWLRCIADFLEIQNKPFWDSYDKWCEENEDEMRKELELATGFREEDFE